ncbi:nuclear transport factor 2 family protein [Lyngbya confervoides]|uniref:Nuclear transport factor 2 family protein n=1 Tax=Lyngbya confervoides BDU141951 TaxID=1574623 RepID=A0ABD4T1S4_9CYAN|nr:nuclear transport factor 2 family protein [Lyngbya confervoides]MCM1982544.1 nuclear transport factor 2 family protein [Lyngbya confervoides BDU141951]
MSSSTLHLIEAAVEALCSLNAQAFARCFTPDARLVLPNGQQLQGRAEIQGALADLSQRLIQVDLKISGMTIAAGTAYVAWHWRSLARQTGKWQVSDNLIVLQFNQGLISAWREYQAQPLENPASPQPASLKSQRPPDA